jgi:Mg-chelatase subunit ChlD
MGSGAHAAPKAPRNRRGTTAWYVGIAALSLIAAVTVFKLHLASPEATADGSNCAHVDTVRVAVTPAMAGMVTKAAAAVAEDCRRIDVVTSAADVVVRDLLGAGTRPDLWVPDSSAWVARLAASHQSTEVVSNALASSPVILVGGPIATVPSSWTAALQSGQVALPDPMSSGVGALAMVAPRAETSYTGYDTDQVRQMLVPIAQAYGERRADGRPDDVALTSLTSATRKLIPVTEQAYLSAAKTSSIVQPLTPQTGAPLLTYPLVAPAGASVPVLQAGRELSAWFESADGRTALASAGLRRGDGSAQGLPSALAGLKTLAAPESVTVAGDLHTWQLVSVPSSLLAVFDASGSMDFDAGGETRMQLSIGVAEMALKKVYPDHAKIGLWVFSIDQGGKGQDWRELAPIRRLDDVVNGVTQRERLIGLAPQMLQMTHGGTGLYDTTLAAYKAAQDAYDPNYANSLVLLTDGANDDPGSISLDRLLGDLAQLHDPQRPVRIIGIAISKDADFKSLDRIAKSTGGAAYYAENPQDITKVFAQAVLSR